MDQSIHKIKGDVRQVLCYTEIHFTFFQVDMRMVFNQYTSISWGVKATGAQG